MFRHSFRAQFLVQSLVTTDLWDPTPVGPAELPLGATTCCRPLPIQQIGSPGVSRALSSLDVQSLPPHASASVAALPRLPAAHAPPIPWRGYHSAGAQGKPGLGACSVWGTGRGGAGCRLNVEAAKHAARSKGRGALRGGLSEGGQGGASDADLDARTAQANLRRDLYRTIATNREARGTTESSISRVER